MEAVGRLRTRLSELDPERADALLAGLLAAAFCIELAVIGEREGSAFLAVAFTVPAILGLTWRRQWPFTVSLVFMALGLTQELLGGYAFHEPIVPFLCFVILLYSVGRYCTAVPIWFAFVVLMAGLWVVIAASEEALLLSDMIWSLLLFGGPVLAGRGLRNRSQLAIELAEKAERAEAERAERARLAADEERSRIAAELQSVVANGVSAIVVQAEAVPRLVDGGERAAAGEALAVIEETGRDALAEMRRLLGVLRRDEGAELAPQPSLARVDDLLARYAEHGLELSLDVDGSARTLPPGVDLAAYRVLERALEGALANPRQQTGVLIRYGDRDVEIRIRALDLELPEDELAALRERLAIYGGHLRAGEVGDDYVLRARLPLEVGR